VLLVEPVEREGDATGGEQRGGQNEQHEVEAPAQFPPFSPGKHHL